MIRAAKALILIALPLTVSGCGLQDAQDAEPIAQMPVDCVSGWEGQLARVAEIFASDPQKIFHATYAYNVTDHDLDAVRAWFGLDQPDGGERPRMSMTLGGNQSFYKQWLSQPAGANGAYYNTTDLAVIRLRGKPGTLPEMIAQGCAKSSDTILLFHIHYSFEGFEDEGANSIKADGSAHF